ncbi:MAG: hypothetical protein ACOVNU_02370 [Candidatus Kapaibacteriota bacterium]
MKKLILLFTLAIVSLSCSKSDDDNSEKQLTPNFQNMVGDWKFTSVIRPDGTIDPYIGTCTTKEDHAVIIYNTKITTYIHDISCSFQSDPCDNYYFDGNRIINCLEVFNNARVTSLTSTTMKIEYDNPRYFGPIIGAGAKGIIFTK